MVEVRRLEAPCGGVRLRIAVPGVFRPDRTEGEGGTSMRLGYLFILLVMVGAATVGVGSAPVWVVTPPSKGGGSGVLAMRIVEELRKVEPSRQGLPQFEVVPTGEAIEHVRSGKWAFASVDVPAQVLRELSRRDLAREFGRIPVASIVCGFAYRLDGVAEPLILDRRAIFGIYSGTIRRWNDEHLQRVNGGRLPDLPIHLVVTRSESTPSKVLRRYLSSGGEGWTDQSQPKFREKWPHYSASVLIGQMWEVFRETNGAIGFTFGAAAIDDEWPMASFLGQSVKPEPPTRKSADRAVVLAFRRDGMDADPTVIDAEGAYPFVALPTLVYRRDDPDSGVVWPAAEYLLAMEDKGEWRSNLAPLPREVIDMIREEQTSRATSQPSQ